MNNAAFSPSNKFAQDKGKNLLKAVKALYHLDLSLSFEKRFLAIILVPVEENNNNNNSNKQTSSWYFYYTSWRIQRKTIGLESLQSNLVLIRVFSQYILCSVVLENDFNLALFIQQMIMIMTLSYDINRQGFLKFLYQETSLIYFHLRNSG